MKKLIALLSVLALMLSLAACGKEPAGTSSDLENPSSQTQSVVDDIETGLIDGDCDPENDKAATETPATDNKTETPTTDGKTEAPATNQTTQTPTQETPKQENTTTETPKQETPVQKEETTVDAYFHNATLDGRWSREAITVVPVEVYYKDGKFIANCYVVNGYSTTATQVNIEQIDMYDKNNTLFAGAVFGAQNFTIEPLSYIKHTFTFGADTIRTTNIDISSLRLVADFAAHH